VCYNDIPVLSLFFQVIWLDEDSALEYDCNEGLVGPTDYCVHFMSRTSAIAPDKLQEMMDFVGRYTLHLMY
jgi:hypothetical protein